MSDAAERVIADAQDGLELGGYSVQELVDAAVVDYRRGGSWASLAIGYELGNRGWVPTRSEHEALGLSGGVKWRDG